MARYQEFVGVRMDPIVLRCIERLASKWKVKERVKKGELRGYKSETIRLAIVYAYLVEVMGVNPKEAPEKAAEYLMQVAIGY